MTPAPTHERQVLDALPMTICTIDLEGRVTFINRSASRVPLSAGAPRLWDLGMTIGASLLASIGDRALRARLEQAMSALREGRAPALAWEYAHGSPADARIALVQVTTLADGPSLSGYTVSAIDITASHRAREVLIDTGMALARTISIDRVLHEVSQQLRRAMDCEAVAIALADEETSALRLVHETGFGEPAAALERRLAPAWHDALAARAVTSATTPGGAELTAPMESTGGIVGAVTLLAAERPTPHLLDEALRVVGTIASQAAGAIERAWLVRRVGHTRRLEALTEVSVGVAHELRNPLFGISSAAQLLRFRVKDDPVVEKNVGRILREVERLNGMVAALLEFGQPGPIALAVGDPDLVWDDVLEGQRGRLESRAQLLQRRRADPPVRCRIDPRQLAQVFVNLLVNASDAAPEGTDLTLESSMLRNGGWRCRVHNGGPSIPPDVLPRAFEMFVSTKAGGSGIGLALCHRIIAEHGGTITLDSAPQAGTSAVVVLPGVP